MKRIIFILTFFSIAALAFGQVDKKQDGKLDRRLQREAEMQADINRLNALAEEQNLVLEATGIYGRHGYNTFNVSPNNFVAIDSNRFMLQTASFNQIGANGMGGITIRGTITDYKVTPAEGKKPLIVVAQVSTFGIGGGTLTFRIHSSENAQATFIGNAGQITFQGPVTSREESSVFEGQRLY